MIHLSLADIPDLYSIDTNPNENRNIIKDVLKSRWEYLSTETDVFRYKILKNSKRIVKGNYTYNLVLNPERGTNRRAPIPFQNVKQLFNANDFNFTKVSADEIVLTVSIGNEKRNAKILVNVSPISKYHSLLIPDIDRGLPQIVTLDSLIFVAELMFLWPDRDIKIAFNSLCALASVNHLHYHLLFVNEVLPVEYVGCRRLTGHLYRLAEDYPSSGFCFQIKSKTDIVEICTDAYKCLEFFLENNIAHNLLLTRGKPLDSSIDEEVLRIVIWPRKSSSGVKQSQNFNVAVLEMSGFFPIFSTEVFENISAEELERDLRKYSVDDFDSLIDEIKNIF